MSVNTTSTAMLKIAALKLPTPIYEDARTLFDKYGRFLEKGDGGQEAYIFDDFFESADSIIASDAYRKLAKSDQSVHENIMTLLRSLPVQDYASLPLARYLKSAAVVLNTKGYQKVITKLYNVNVERHCVRCHKTYIEGDGKRCWVPHVMLEDYDRRVERVETLYRSECCGARFKIAGDEDGWYDDCQLQEEKNLCVNLPHTTNSREVERSLKPYNDVNILHCEIVDGICRT